MSRIAQAFANGKAFIAFLTCGDPDIETTEQLIKTIAESGADLIELGIPFSDPTAEGPVIQAANLRAINGGATTDKIFAMVERIRPQIKIPMVFMTYANVVFGYGTERFIHKAAEVGIDGLILPDVPYEEKGDFLPYCQQNGLELISLVAPTSDDRIAMIAREAEGFVYCVSSLGVTGERSKFSNHIGEVVSLVRHFTSVPTAIGFGISTPQQASDMAMLADGVIVGSAIVKLVAQYGRQAIPHVAEYVHSMKTAISEIK